MGAGEWIVELLGWATLGSWWQRNPRTDDVAWEWAEVDVASADFLRIGSIPEPLRLALRAEHRRRLGVEP